MSLHFASQAEADRYVVERQMSSKSKLRMTPARRAYLERMEQLRDSYAAPVHKLPDDVLAMVFRTGAECDVAEDKKDIAFVLKVSQVISRWRRVALATPSLWTALTIKISQCGDPSDQSLLTKLLLRRSSPLPIQLEVVVLRDYAYTRPNTHLLEPSVWGPVLERCEMVAFSGLNDFDTELRLEGVSPYTSGLKKLVLNSVTFPTITSLADGLRGMPSLRELLFLDNGVSVVSMSDNIEPVVLSQLSFLSFMDDDSDLSLNAFLDIIHAPNLHHLRYAEFESQYIDIPIRSPVNFAALRSFHFLEFAVSPVVVLETLQGMPALEVLFLGVTFRLAVPDDISLYSPLPPLVEIEVGSLCTCIAHNRSREADEDCFCFDQFTMHLVDETVSSLKHFKFSNKRNILSQQAESWIRERVPNVVDSRAVSRGDQTGL